MRYRNVVVQFSHPPHSPLVSAGAAPHALLRAVTSASLEKGGVVAGGARPSRLLVLVASSGVGAATSGPGSLNMLSKLAGFESCM
jgi:hypothetical protein